ncbi:MAG: nicotinamide-nucleotide amidohydrolase family protein [Thiolinea sp.]
MQQQEWTGLLDRLGGCLRGQGLRLVTAESCTGGWIAKVCTDLAGSSDWFECGFVSYSNTAKQDMLEVSAETLTLHGAVSEAVAAEMVRGAIANSQADVAVAVTGIAGPGRQCRKAGRNGVFRLDCAGLWRPD